MGFGQIRSAAARVPWVEMMHGAAPERIWSRRPEKRPGRVPAMGATDCN